MTVRYVMCIDQGDYKVSLTPHKVYKVVPDPLGEKQDRIRIVDDTGEDYLFSAKHFVEVELSEQAEQAFNRVLV